jgi:2'-5' RNA ligase
MVGSSSIGRNGDPLGGAHRTQLDDVAAWRTKSAAWMSNLQQIGRRDAATLYNVPCLFLTARSRDFKLASREGAVVPRRSQERAVSDLFSLNPAAEAGGSTRHKIFFAIRPTEAAADGLHRLAQRERLRRGMTGWPTPPERLHTSLNGLGAHREPPRGLIARAIKACGTIPARPFVVSFNRLGSWGRGDGQRPFVLRGDEGVAGVYALHDAIHRLLAEAGLVHPRARDFEPHLTLLRDRMVAAEEVVEPVSWPVREFVLLDSIHGEGRHEVLERWALAS